MSANKKIITINALYNLYEDNPNLSFRQCAFLLFSKAKSKRIDVGFKLSTKKSFYDNVLNFIKKNSLFYPPKQRQTNELKQIYFEID